MSWARKHKERILAEQARGEGLAQSTATYQAAPGKVANTLANSRKQALLYQESLQNDLALLKSHNDHATRDQLKEVELIPKYWPYVESFIASDFNFNNPLVGYLLIWLFDVRDFSRGFELAHAMIAKKQSLPFKSDVPTFVADSIKDWATIQLDNNSSFEPYLSQVLSLVDDSAQPWRINEQLHAKLYRLKGDEAFNSNNFANAVTNYEKAYQLYDKSGVKTNLEKARKKLANQPTP